MKTLRLREGDLVLSHADYDTVTGTGKVAQDLRGALLEPIGNDRFHPGWGSDLGEHIATIANEETRLSIESEVNRVISNYAAVQRDKIEADITSDSDSRFTTDEVLSRITGVSATVGLDTVSVQVGLNTVSGETVVLNEAVS